MTAHNASPCPSIPWCATSLHPATPHPGPQDQTRDKMTAHNASPCPSIPWCATSLHPATPHPGPQDQNRSCFSASQPSPTLPRPDIHAPAFHAEPHTEKWSLCYCATRATKPLHSPAPHCVRHAPPFPNPHATTSHAPDPIITTKQSDARSPSPRQLSQSAGQTVEQAVCRLSDVA